MLVTIDSPAEHRFRTWQSFPSGRVVKNLPTNAGDARDQVQSLAQEDSWRRKWPPAPRLLPGKSRKQGNLGGYSLWDCEELDTTKGLRTAQHAGTYKGIWLFGPELILLPVFLQTIKNVSGTTLMQHVIFS